MVGHIISYLLCGIIFGAIFDLIYLPRLINSDPNLQPKWYEHIFMCSIVVVLWLPLLAYNMFMGIKEGLND